MKREDIITKLENSREILLLLPMAIGDFCYTQMVLQVFHECYPHLQIDVMFDELFHLKQLHRGKGKLVNPAVIDWAEETGIFRDVYRDLFEGNEEQAIQRAKQRRYPLVVSLAGRGALAVAEKARDFSPDGFIVAWQMKRKWWRFGMDGRRYQKAVDLEVTPKVSPGDHMVDRYADFFCHFANIPDTNWQDRANWQIPERFIMQARERLSAYGIENRQDVILINPFAKNRKRTWPLTSTMECIRLLQEKEEFADTSFLVNGLPSDQEDIRESIRQAGLARVYPFTAQGNFFELPAMLSQCRLVVTVETSVMHLASLLHVPQVALMRRKTPHWRPLRETDCEIIWNEKAHQHIADIKPTEVVLAIEDLLGKMYR